jgi:hypothetical protein
MSGDPSESAVPVSTLFKRGAERDTIVDVILFLLTYQYVQSNELVGRMFQVAKRTGMGLKHSSELANVALAMVAEESFACDPISRRQFGMLLYVRYFDDIFIVAPQPKTFHKWFSRFKVVCHQFRPEIVESSGVGVDMLNMHIHMLGGCQHTDTTCKATSLSVPLMCDSAHAPHVHRWPTGALKGVLRLCGPRQNAMRVGEALSSGFNNFRAHPTSVAVSVRFLLRRIRLKVALMTI